MIGLGIAIALLISSVVCADGGDPVLVAAQLIAAGIFYCGSQLVILWSKLHNIEEISERYLMSDRTINLTLNEEDEDGTEREVG